MNAIISTIICVLTLGFTVVWALWLYRKQQKSRLILYVQPAVIHNSDFDLFFSTRKNGVKKSEKIERGSFTQMMISIKVQNVGTIPATILKFLAIDKVSKIEIELKNLWVLVDADDKERLPHVLLPGAFWEGFIDWYGVQNILVSRDGRKAFWDLTIKCFELNGNIHKSEERFSEIVFNDILKKRKNAEIE
jgi:hypothetical protein